MTQEEQNEFRMEIILAKMAEDKDRIISACDDYLYALEEVAEITE